jgi:hypothetical protein
MTAKSVSIKGAGCKFGGCASKAVGLTSGGLLHVLEAGLRVERSTLIVQQESAAGIVVPAGRDEGPNGRKRQVGGATR